MPVRKIRQFFLYVLGPEYALHVLFFKNNEGLGKLLAHTNIIDNKAKVLSRKCAVSARNRLKKCVLPQSLIKVHDLLYRRVESGQQLVTHDQELKRIFRIKKGFFDALFLLWSQTILIFPFRIFIPHGHNND